MPRINQLSCCLLLMNADGTVWSQNCWREELAERGCGEGLQDLSLRIWLMKRESWRKQTAIHLSLSLVRLTLPGKQRWIVSPCLSHNVSSFPSSSPTSLHFTILWCKCRNARGILGNPSSLNSFGKRCKRKSGETRLVTCPIDGHYDSLRNSRQQNTIMKR